MPSSTEVHELDGWAVVAVTGELDVHAAPRLRSALVDLLRAGTRRVVIDTTQVTFIDSTGLGVLIGALKRVRDDDGELRVVANGEQVLRMLRVTGLHRVFTPYPDLHQAVAAAS